MNLFTCKSSHKNRFFVWLKLTTIGHFSLPTKLTGRQVQMLQNLTSQLTLIGIVVGSLIRKQRAKWLNGFGELNDNKHFYMHLELLLWPRLTETLHSDLILKWIEMIESIICSVYMWLLIVFRVTFHSFLLHCSLSTSSQPLPGLKEIKVYVWNKKKITITEC